MILIVGAVKKMVGILLILNVWIKLYLKIENFALEMCLSFTSEERKIWAALIYHKRERNFLQNGERERGFSGWARARAHPISTSALMLWKTVSFWPFFKLQLSKSNNFCHKGLGEHEVIFEGKRFGTARIFDKLKFATLFSVRSKLGKSAGKFNVSKNRADLCLFNISLSLILPYHILFVNIVNIE